MAYRPDRKILLNLRDKLPYGAQKRIAEELGVSAQTVYNTLQGFSYNEAVYRAAIRAVKAEKARQEELEAELQSAGQ